METLYDIVAKTVLVLAALGGAAMVMLAIAMGIDVLRIICRMLYESATKPKRSKY